MATPINLRRHGSGQASPNQVEVQVGATFSSHSRSNTKLSREITFMPRYFRSRMSRLKTALFDVSGSSSFDSGSHSSLIDSHPNLARELESALIGSDIKGGLLKFQSGTTTDVATWNHPYVIMDTDTISFRNLLGYMAVAWRLEEPKVVLNVISNADFYRTWSDASHVEDFQMGLIKAARLTKMWVLMEGLTGGMSAMIGEAAFQERLRRRMLKAENVEMDQEGALPQLVVVGIAVVEDLPYGEPLLEHAEIARGSRGVSPVIIKNQGSKRELNPHCSHFVLLRVGNHNDKESRLNAHFSLESQCLRYMARVYDEKASLFQADDHLDVDPGKSTSPMVGLLLQGGPREIDRVLWLLKKHIPTVVIKGQGFASSLLAYAFSEAIKGGDSLHIENIVRPQLMQKVKEVFQDIQDNQQACMRCRDQILECVKYSVQKDSCLLTIMDPSLGDVDYKELSQFILTAIISAQPTAQSYQLRERINWNLRLALDWNAPDFAATEILNKMELHSYRIRDDRFLEALLLPGREPFVDLFLSTGFSLCRFLTVSRTHYLYHRSLSNEFFVTICLYKVLRVRKMPEDFLTPKGGSLNRLLAKVSGLSGLVDLEFKSEYHLASTPAEQNKADLRALLELIYWSVLTNNRKLAEVLWRRTTEPIAVALVISNMYHRLQKYYITDVDLQMKVKQEAIYFGKLAFSVMDVMYSESKVMALQALTRRIPNFNQLTLSDLALIGNNKFFIAHQCCQQSVRERWLGMLTIRNFGRSGRPLPEYVKIFCCVFLVFPMYFWLSFDRHVKGRSTLDDDDEEAEDTNQLFDETDGSFSQETPQDVPKSSSARERASRLVSWFHVNPKKRRKKSKKSVHTPLWRKFYYLWTAPITKFWLNQYFFLAYLILYAYNLMLPYCGDSSIHRILFPWSLCMCLEHIVILTKWKLKFPTSPISWFIVAMLIELFISLIFLSAAAEEDENAHRLLSAVLPVRAVHAIMEKLDYKARKGILSMGLIFHCYRAARSLFPASHEMGPRLVSITILTQETLVDWVKLWMVCLVSGGVAIQMALYPAEPLSWHVVGKTVYRVGMSLWFNDIEDVYGDAKCSPLFEYPGVQTCNASSIQPHILSKLEPCPFPSWVGYVVVVQTVLISRLVFYTLMFAMFSATIAKTQQQSNEIWKYQFYVMMADYETRSVVPIPLTVITYPFHILYFLAKRLFGFFFQCSHCAKNISKKTPRHDEYSIPYNQMKSYLSTMAKKEKKVETADILGQLEMEASTQHLMAKRLNDRLVRIENNQTSTALMLETLIAELNALNPQRRAQKAQGQVKFVHYSSRRSPYPGTDVERFPVLERDVPWDVKFEAYDPVTYTKPISEMPYENRKWADPGEMTFFAKRNTEFNIDVPVSMATSVDSLFSDTSGIRMRELEAMPIFNTHQKVTLPNGQDVIIDRTSYITIDGEPLQYDLDFLGLPKNPMGRTGVRGRGKLLRWGPNHYISAVISRWRGGKEGGRPSMEVLGLVDPLHSVGGEACLPGGFVETDSSPHSVMCESVLKYVFKEPFPEYLTGEYDAFEMVKFFSQFASNDSLRKRPALFANYGYSAFLVYRGYMDDGANTDNAWREAEIWNFHYKYKDSFDIRIKDNDQAIWMPVSDNMQLTSSEMMAVSESAKIHDANMHE